MNDKTKKQYAHHFADSEGEITLYAGKRKKLIILEKPAENPPDGYVQLVLAYKGEKFVALVPEKVKNYMAGGNGNSSTESLDEITEFYRDCSDFEGELYFANIFSTPQTEISTLARKSYGVHILNRLVKNTNDGIEHISSEIDRLCINDSYVSDRIKAMAAIQLGKKTSELKEANLEDLLVDITTKVQHETTKAYQVACDCGSHIEYRTQYKTEITERDETFTSNPEITKLENEIEDYRKQKDKETTPHDTQIIRQYANATYITAENPDKQFDICPPETNPKRPPQKHPNGHGQKQDPFPETQEIKCR